MSLGALEKGKVTAKLRPEGRTSKVSQAKSRREKCSSIGNSPCKNLEVSPGILLLGVRVVQCRQNMDLAAYRWSLKLLKQKRIREGMA